VKPWISIADLIAGLYNKDDNDKGSPKGSPCFMELDDDEDEEEYEDEYEGVTWNHDFPSYEVDFTILQVVINEPEEEEDEEDQ